MTRQVSTDEFENEQELIKQLGREIALVQNREQLYRLINGYLKEIIGFSHSTIFILNNDGREISNFLKGYGKVYSKMLR